MKTCKVRILSLLLQLVHALLAGLISSLNETCQVDVSLLIVQPPMVHLTGLWYF